MIDLMLGILIVQNIILFALHLLNRHYINEVHNQLNDQFLQDVPQ